MRPQIVLTQETHYRTLKAILVSYYTSPNVSFPLLLCHPLIFHIGLNGPKYSDDYIERILQKCNFSFSSSNRTVLRKLAAVFVQSKFGTRSFISTTIDYRIYNDIEMKESSRRFILQNPLSITISPYTTSKLLFSLSSALSSAAYFLLLSISFPLYFSASFQQYQKTK